MAYRNSEDTTSTFSLESNTLFSLFQKIQRKEKARQNKDDDGSENCSKHSGETSNSSGTNATSHLSGSIPENEIPGTPIVEFDPANAAASRYTQTHNYCNLQDAICNLIMGVASVRLGSLKSPNVFIKAIIIGLKRKPQAS